MRTKQSARKAFAPLHSRGGGGVRTRGGAVAKSGTVRSPGMMSKPFSPIHKRAAGGSSGSGNGTPGASGSNSKEKKVKKGDDEEHAEDEEEDIGSEDIDDEDVEAEGEEDSDVDGEVDEEMDDEGEPDSEEEEYMQMLETFQEIVDSQTYVGSFPLNETFARILGVTKALLIKEATEKKLNGEAFVTALAVAFVDTRLHLEDNMTKEWEPMKTKAADWLQEKFPEAHAEVTAAAKVYLEEM